METLSLFTGAGGLDIGLDAAGFRVKACVEIDEDARNTINLNRPKWNLLTEGNIHAYRSQELLAAANIRRKQLTLISGGPPCQPFSRSGLWTNSGAQRFDDPRASTIQKYLQLIEDALPEVFLLENVKGLMSGGGNDTLRLFSRALNRINKRNKTRYELSILHVNAADCGVPQIRHRVFLVGHRGGRKMEGPTRTFCDPAKPSDDLPTWRTAWDALADLDEPNLITELSVNGKWGTLLPSIPEGKNYLWHTPQSEGMPLFGWRTRYWTFLLKLAKNYPSWTLQASPGTATGPFHWNNRRLTVNEIARLQTFPDEHKFVGSYSAARRQLGNAVPCAMAELMGLEIRRQLFNERVRRSLSLIPEKQKRCPPPEPTKRVPRRFFSLRGEHAVHPGSGLGPQPRLSQ